MAELTDTEEHQALCAFISVPAKGTVIDGFTEFEKFDKGLWFMLAGDLSDVTKLTVNLNRETNALYQVASLEERVAALEATT